MPICAIHQPNFFPWLGYFDKIRKADVFVFLDEVDYPRSGSGGMGSWTNRVKIDIQGKAKWLGCPLERISSAKPIGDVRIAEDGKWRSRILRTLQMNYAKAPGYERAMAVLKPLILYSDNRLADFNIHAIEALCAVIGVSTDFRRQRDISTGGKATSLLIAITRTVGADAYLCGGGAGGYQDDDLFTRQGVTLIYQNFTPFSYRSPRAFLPGLSIIDFLMWSEEWRLPD